MAHLAALGGETARHVAAHATNDRAAIETPVPAAGARLGGTGRTEGFRFREGGPWDLSTNFTRHDVISDAGLSYP